MENLPVWNRQVKNLKFSKFHISYTELIIFLKQYQTLYLQMCIFATNEKK